MADRPIVRSYEYVMSVEAVASSWARSENAPDGAVVVADNEVSGRLRGGPPWTLGGGDGLMMAMVVRPEIDPLREALLWLPASLAAADCMKAITGDQLALVWPDRVVDHKTWAPRCHTNVVVQLGPGRVEHAIFVVRADLSTRPDSEVGVDEVVGTFVASTRQSVSLLRDDPQQLLDRYTERCALMGELVRVELIPRGATRGRVVAVDADGFLVLESATGMLERVAPASLRSLERMAADNGPAGW